MSGPSTSSNVRSTTGATGPQATKDTKDDCIFSRNSGTFPGGSCDRKTDSFTMPHMWASVAVRSTECEGNGNSVSREIKRSPKSCSLPLTQD